MTKGGLPWQGAVRLGLALLTGALTTGCGALGGTGTSSAAHPSSSPSPTPPEELCTRIVAHWSREVLDSTTYGDYQSMGMSNGQYEILRTVVDAARAEKERQGADAADKSIDREAREGCAAWYRSGGPAEGAW